MRIRKERYSVARYYVNIFLIVMVILIIVGVIIGVSYSESKSNDSNPCDSSSNSGVSRSNSGVSRSNSGDIVSAPTCKFIHDKNKKFTYEDIINARGDGNCFFHAVLYGLKCLGLYNGDHNQLRSELCDSMLSNPFSRNHISNNSYFLGEYSSEDDAINKYVDNMRKDGEWGTYVEIFCIGQMFQDKCYFQCYYLPHENIFLDKIEILMIPDPPGLPIINICNNNLHYDSLPTYQPPSSSS